MSYMNSGMTYGMIEHEHGKCFQDRPISVAMSDVEHEERARYV